MPNSPSKLEEMIVKSLVLSRIHAQFGDSDGSYRLLAEAKAEFQELLRLIPFEEVDLSAACSRAALELDLDIVTEHNKEARFVLVLTKQLLLAIQGIHYDLTNIIFLTEQGLI